MADASDAVSPTQVSRRAMTMRRFYVRPLDILLSWILSVPAMSPRI